MTNCTCPSGDGSLRWPCPVHLPTSQSKINEILRALDHARGLINHDNPEPPYYTFDYVSRAMQFTRDIGDELADLKAAASVTDQPRGMPDKARIALDSLDADAVYLLSRVKQETLSTHEAALVIRQRIEIARTAMNINSPVAAQAQSEAQQAGRQIKWIQHPRITDVHDDVLTDRGKNIRAEQQAADIEAARKEQQ